MDPLENYLMVLGNMGSGNFSLRDPNVGSVVIKFYRKVQYHYTLVLTLGDEISEIK